MLAGAVLYARDGIVGSWKGNSNQLSVDDLLIGNDPRNMEEWPTWVRSFICEADLLSKFYYQGYDNGGEGAIRIHLRKTVSAGDPPQVSYDKILDLTRPSHADFVAQLELVNNYADLRDDRAAEILTQVGFPTPFFGGIVGTHPQRTKYTLEIVGIAQMLAAKVAMRVKHALACLRPDKYSPQIQPLVPMPGHGTLPSAHAVEAFIVAKVLSILIHPERQERTDQLMLQAARIAVNRTVAGVHFPADSMAGAMIGLVLGEYLAACAGSDHVNAVTRATFDGQGVGNADFYADTLQESGDLKDFEVNGNKIVEIDSPAVVVQGEDVSKPLNWLWKKAVDEWKTPAQRAAGA